MPLYDFACDACDERFEAWAKPGEAPACAACGSESTRRLFTPISPPAKMGLRGAAARQSDAVRADREWNKKEAFKAERRKKREERGGS
jgi:putative FmdB family regulatory protein